MPVDEPVLAVDDIQGDILAGFRKDHVRLIFFRLRDGSPKPFKNWLKAFASRVASLRQVDAFNDAFRAARLQLDRDPTELSALWRNVSFTAEGLTKLVGAAEVAKFADSSFRAGAEQLSSTLGDPDDPNPGSPSTWVIGAGAATPDGLIILAADSVELVDSELTSITAELAPFVAAAPHVEAGETRKSLPGHEHFGFKDGISQPAVRGKYPDGSYLTPRYVDPADPRADYFAAPGRPLIWPGEFLLNGLKQKGSNADPLEHRSVVDGPAWATNGSYLVFRRLRQDVELFEASVDALFQAIRTDPGFPSATREQAGAMLVGRFASGCPLMRSLSDDPALGGASYAANDFNFSTASSSFPLIAGAPVPADPFARAMPDRNGMRCPFGAHIRKVNPRDDSTDFGSGSNNLQRRIIRRGIPYGPEWDPAQPDELDRGLLFLSYQASIELQFQVLITDWVNSDQAPQANSGFDPVISSAANDQFIARRPDGSTLAVKLASSPVTATGAAFLLAPPISALRGRLAR